MKINIFEQFEAATTKSPGCETTSLLAQQNGPHPFQERDKRLKNKGRRNLRLGWVECSAFLFLTGSALADSMMLSTAELEAIGIVSKKAKPDEIMSATETHNSKLRLDGIIFQGEKNWAIWLNGQRFSCGQHPANYKIVKVCHNCVEIIAASESESQATPIILSPGHIY